ncbi:ABC Transporter A family protein [Acrasis kona]|uniref:ABC Transporter A family protein n=1 Tax=Acrasis kona TaxID=1008807 RepID=A0AAW2Z7X6_9EUKA
MSIIARRQGLSFGSISLQAPDVDGSYTVGQKYPPDATGLPDVVAISSDKELNDFVQKYPNVTQVAANVSSLPLPVLPYHLYFNATGTNANEVSTSTIRAIDEAILERYGGASAQNASINIQTRGFPKVVPQLSASNVVGTMGALWFYCPPMFNFMILLNQLVTENELKLRLSMRTMGLKNSIYWFAWFWTNTVINIGSTLILIAFGAMFQFLFFLKGNFVVLFLLFFLFSTSLVPVAFFLSSFLNQTKTASTVGFLVFVAGLLLQVVFTNLPIYYWYLDSSPRVLRDLFPFYVAFDFSKMFADINTLTQPQLSQDGATQVADGYSFVQLFKKFHVAAYNVDSPPGAQSLGMFLIMTVIFLVLAWYFDNIIPLPRRDLWFPLQPAYWGITIFSKQDQVKQSSASITQEEREQMSQDALEEMERALKEGNQDGLRIININKNFKSYWSMALSAITGGKVRDRSFKAVNNMFLNVTSGQCLALLGHNGAGKTTLVNMLTGLFGPTSGDAIVCGHSLRGQNGMDLIRKVLGVCPQHDILFPELTARQHLNLFADLKGIPVKGRKSIVDRKLAQVNLSHVADHLAGSFSGGMRRRLSLAISCIGDPRILFLDEPTTGLDPLVKREVWDLIKEMKQDCIVILTTHSMAECEYLSDRVAIMAHGRIRCIGDALNLRNRFGDGYKVNLFVQESDKVESIKNQMLSNYDPKDISLCAQNSNYLQFAVGKDVMKQVFFTLESGGVPGIKDWSFSQTSLEDVFLQITGAARKKIKTVVQRFDLFLSS